MIATTIPAMGVHKPASRRLPVTTAMISGATVAGPCSDTSNRPDIPYCTKARPAPTRRHKRPNPGGPSGNVENRRCKKPSRFYGRKFVTRCDSLDTVFQPPPFRGGSYRLQLDDPALDPDGDGVGAVVCAEFGEDVLDVALHRFLRDRELGRNLFVGVPAGHQPQHVDFP